MLSTICKIAISGLLFVGACGASKAETYSDLEGVVKKTAQLVRSQFVVEATAQKTADELLDRYNAGKYADIGTAEQLERQLTDELRAISGDTHIGIVFDPESVARYRARAEAETSEEARIADLANEAAASEDSRLDSYGIRAVEVLLGGVGYLRLDYFDGHNVEGAPAIAAAMNLLAGSDAIILDLRRNGGGNSRILPLFLGYFLGPEPIHFATRSERWKGSVEALYTDASVKGARHYEKPVYILTSGTTYSLAEQVAYHLKSFDRATIIGERTYGGGNGWDPVVLNDDFYLRISRLAFVSAVTQSMFAERVGISPDIAVSASNARQRAYIEALANLHAATSDAEKHRQIEWVQRVIVAHGNSAEKSVDDNAKYYAGKFDEYVFEPRNDGLWLSYRGLPFVKLDRLAPGLYFDDRSIQRQFQFANKLSLPAVKVIIARYGRKPVEIARSDVE